ncbi:ribosome silencing factor [uncultured Acetobacterium sp.]|uniref:ribosome silencing factor n=1 Tax=uncultured Acetobacterium sp. TaxID=217139 RepID=UPI0025E6D429|nr:ribosome silencing factor [uncultured Acetobacterium sp.]
MIFINPEEFAKKIEAWIEAKNGDEIEVINVTEMTTIANYFVIASGNSERQVKAIADNVEYEAKELEIFPKNIEGQREGRWILLDYYDVIVHIFHTEERQLYNLEKLWKNSPVTR